MRYTAIFLSTLVLGGAAVAQAVQPVAPVPRFGPGSHVDETSARGTSSEDRPQPRLGRAGPRGTMMPSGQVGPACMTPLWKAGFRTNHVECPLYLPTRPGVTQQCTATDAGGAGSQPDRHVPRLGCVDSSRRYRLSIEPTPIHDSRVFEDALFSIERRARGLDQRADSAQPHS